MLCLSTVIITCWHNLLQRVLHQKKYQVATVHWPLMGRQGCHIWYSQEGTGRGRSSPRPFLVVANVTAHPSTASVPIMVRCSAVFMCSLGYRVNSDMRTQFPHRRMFFSLQINDWTRNYIQTCGVVSFSFCTAPRDRQTACLQTYNLLSTSRLQLQWNIT